MRIRTPAIVMPGDTALQAQPVISKWLQAVLNVDQATGIARHHVWQLVLAPHSPPRRQTKGEPECHCDLVRRRDEQVSRPAIGAVRHVLSDGSWAELALEAVQLVADLIRKRKCSCSSQVGSTVCLPRMSCAPQLPSCLPTTAAMDLTGFTSFSEPPMPNLDLNFEC